MHRSRPVHAVLNRYGLDSGLTFDDKGGVRMDEILTHNFIKRRIKNRVMKGQLERYERRGLSGSYVLQLAILESGLVYGRIHTPLWNRHFRKNTHMVI
jgi:hypothetical protein